MNFAGQVDNNGQPVAKVNYGASNAPERYILGRKVICCDYLPNLDANTAVNTAVALIFDLKRLCCQHQLCNGTEAIRR